MKLVDQFRCKLKALHRAKDTEKAYVSWVLKFIRFHNLRHPRDMGEIEIEQFLTHLAVEKNVAASTQNQAFNAILFLYKQVLKRKLKGIQSIRAKRPKRLPVVLNDGEVQALLAMLHGTRRLMAEVVYGSGLRERECCRPGR